MKKKKRAKNIIQKNINIFSCPHCQQELNLINNSLQCNNNHCFDLSKNGYVNLLTANIQSNYDKNMFTARNEFIKQGYFKQIHQLITREILSNIKTQIKEKENNNLKILDAGCGEGSHLSEIKNMIEDEIKYPVSGIGLDLAKEGIYIAAREYPGYIWCVGDLAQVPFSNNSVDLIINILSPANYAEFSRLLNENGILIKVIPASNYLKELRNLFFNVKDKKEYSNHKVKNLFKEKLTLISEQTIETKEKINNKDYNNLLKMTPLLWDVAPNKLNEIKNNYLKEITIELDILIGRFK